MLSAFRCAVTNTSRRRIIPTCLVHNYQEKSSVTSSTPQISSSKTPPNTKYSLKYIQLSESAVIFSNGYNLKDNSITGSRSTSRASKFLPIAAGDSEHNDSHTKDSEKFSRKPRSFLTMLSILGFFRGFYTGDIEEEKAKLTDEQKIKKMKPVELLIARGVLEMCDQEYTKADVLFHKALRISQTEQNEEQETLILNLLASNFFESGDLDAAEKLFINLMKRMIAHGIDDTDPAILELSLKLSSIYSKEIATRDKALQGFKFVISNLKSKLHVLLQNVEEIDIRELSDDLKNELALLGWSYDWFGKHLIAINDFNGASEMLQKALQISSKVLGPLHDQTLILLNDVGTTMAMNDAPEEGKTYIKKAVEGAIESQSKELASFYVNLGLVNLKLKKLSEAKRYCEYSIELALKNGEHHNSQEVIMLSKRCLNEVKKLLEIDNNQ